MEEEVWKDIKGYEGLYQVSNLGRVRSLNHYRKNNPNSGYMQKGKILKCRHDNVKRRLYLYINLSKNGKTKKFDIHRLVAQEFIANPDNKSQVNHKNGNKLDNRVQNLEWVTGSENIKHAINTGLKKKPIPMLGKFGIEHNRSKSIYQISKEGKIINEFGSMHEATRMTGIRTPAICLCCKRKQKTAGGYIWRYKEEQ